VVVVVVLWGETSVGALVLMAAGYYGSKLLESGDMAVSHGSQGKTR
jgi:hypothetical protein